MAISSTSGAWQITVREADGLASLDEVDFASDVMLSGTVSGSIDQALAQFDAPTSGNPYAASLTASVTLDQAEDIGFYLFAAGHARLFIDGEMVGEVSVADQPGAGPGPCPANGGAVCLCQADNTVVQDKISALVSEGTHELRIEYLNLDPTDAFNAEWAVGDIGRRTLDLSIPEAYIDEDPEGDGAWGDLKDWPLVSIHMAVLDDGRVLTYGGESGSAGNFVLNYDVWDPVTDTHTTYNVETKTDLFCAAMVAIPGTSKVIIVGGDALPDEPFVTRGDIENAYISWSGTTKINIFDADTGAITEAPGGEMAQPRWYPTVVTLDTGQVVVIGGHGGVYSHRATVPEIYT
ncbi:MAG: hypothetical protein AAF718_15250 [Pseudomonadota bacterium]